MFVQDNVEQGVRGLYRAAWAFSRNGKAGAGEVVIAKLRVSAFLLPDERAYYDAAGAPVATYAYTFRLRKDDGF